MAAAVNMVVERIVLMSNTRRFLQGMALLQLVSPIERRAHCHRAALLDRLMQLEVISKR